MGIVVVDKSKKRVFPLEKSRVWVYLRLGVMRLLDEELDSPCVGEFLLENERVYFKFWDEPQAVKIDGLVVDDPEFNQKIKVDRVVQIKSRVFLIGDASEFEENEKPASKGFGYKVKKLLNF